MSDQRPYRMPPPVDIVLRFQAIPGTTMVRPLYVVQIESVDGASVRGDQAYQAVLMAVAKVGADWGLPPSEFAALVAENVLELLGARACETEA